MKLVIPLGWIEIKCRMKIQLDSNGLSGFQIGNMELNWVELISIELNYNLTANWTGEWKLY